MRALRLLTAVVVVATAGVAAAGGQSPAPCADSASAVVHPNGWTELRPPGFATSAIVSWAALPFRPTTMFVTDGTRVLRSVDGGCHWSTAWTPSAADAATVVRAVVAPELDPDAATVYLLLEQTAAPLGQSATRTVVKRSNDAGTTWEDASSGLPALGRPVRLRPSVGRTAYLAIAPTAKAGSQALYVTADGGRSWTERTSLLDLGVLIRDLVVDPRDPTHVWAWDDAALYHSTDSATTFARAVPVADRVSWVDVFPVNGTSRPSVVSAYAASAGRVWTSADGGATWKVAGGPAGVRTSARSLRNLRITGTSTGARTYLTVPENGSPATYDVSPPGRPVLNGLVFSQTGLPVMHAGGTHAIWRLDPWKYGEVAIGSAVLPDSVLHSVAPVRRPATLDPKRVQVTPPQGRAIRVPYQLTMPPRPREVDVFLLTDSTDSMAPYIARLRADLQLVVNGLADNGVSARFGVADFREFPGPPWGAGTGNFAYRRLRAIGPVDRGLRDAIDNLDSGGGSSDGSNAALEALLQTVTGAGRWIGTGSAKQQLVAPGQSAGFRPGALPIVVLASDVAWREATAGYPGPASTEVFAALRHSGVRVVGLAVNDGSGSGTVGTSEARANLEQVAAITGAVAPAGGADCDGDGHIDVAAGAPVVCALRTSAAKPAAVAPAITGLLRAVTDLADVRVDVVGPRGLGTVSGVRATTVDLTRLNHLATSVDFRCADGYEGRSLPVVVRATSRGRELARSNVTVDCQAVRPAGGLKPPAALAAGVVAPLAPPPAIVVGQVQTQPQLQTQQQVQQQGEPHFGTGGLTEEQSELSLARSGAYDEETAAGFAIAAAAMMAGAYGVAMRRSAARAVRRS